MEKQKYSSQKHLELLLLEGLDSGKPIEVNEEWWTQKWAALQKKLEKDSEKKTG